MVMMFKAAVGLLLLSGGVLVGTEGAQASEPLHLCVAANGDVRVQEGSAACSVEGSRTVAVAFGDGSSAIEEADGFDVAHNVLIAIGEDASAAHYGAGSQNRVVVIGHARGYTYDGDGNRVTLVAVNAYVSGATFEGHRNSVHVVNLGEKAVWSEAGYGDDNTAILVALGACDDSASNARAYYGDENFAIAVGECARAQARLGDNNTVFAIGDNTLAEAIGVDNCTVRVIGDGETAQYLYDCP